MSHAGQTPLVAPQTDRISIGRHRISRRDASAAMLAGAAFAFAASTEVAQAQAVTLVEVKRPLQTASEHRNSSAKPFISCIFMLPARPEGS